VRAIVHKQYNNHKAKGKVTRDVGSNYRREAEGAILELLIGTNILQVNEWRYQRRVTTWTWSTESIHYVVPLSVLSASE
jgi:hypothetical protein